MSICPAYDGPLGPGMGSECKRDDCTSDHGGCGRLREDPDREAIIASWKKNT